MNRNGYSLLEILIVIVVGTILVTAVAVNIAPAVLSLNIENVTAQVVATISRVRREALKGNTEPPEFRVDEATASKHPGISITEHMPESANDCEEACGAGERTICVSQIPFCYVEKPTMTFERSSGRLASGQAVFILSKSRKFAVLVSPDGKTDVAELVNGRWSARTEIQFPRGEK